jgi:hypothetical protein
VPLTGERAAEWIERAQEWYEPGRHGEEAA